MASILSELHSIRSKTVLKSFSLLNNFMKTRYSSIDATNQAALTEFDEHEIAAREREEKIQAKRNVSRLAPPHRNLINGTVPYPEPKADYHLSIKYRRKMYGKYGNESGVNPGVMWPTKHDLQLRKEYENVAFPFTVEDMVKSAINKLEKKEAEIWERQKKIVENIKKLGQWKKDLETRRAKKLEAALKERQKKERLIEEVRRHFGYTVDPREEKFQEMLEKKEKEERRLAKQQRQQLREEKYLKELLDKQKDN